MKSKFDSWLGVLGAFVQALLEAFDQLGENPDEIIRHLQTPEGKVLVPGMAEFIVEKMKGKKSGKPLSQQLADWKLFYKKFFRHNLDINNIQIPDQPNGFDRLIVVAKGFTLNQIYAVMVRHFDCWQYTEDLDKVITRNDRDANKTDTYAVWLRDRQEADEENQNLSAKEVWDKKIQGITLAERMLYELKFWDETGDHLDMDNVTLCAGSRRSDDDVPYMSFGSDDQTVSVGWCYSGAPHGHLRARSVGS